MDAHDTLAHAIISQAASNVDALLELFARDDLPGADPLERAKWVLKLTASDWPGMHMGAFLADDSGFKLALADERFYLDPKYWAEFVKPEARATKQMGHFLTAVGLRLAKLPQYVKLNLIIGHEKFGDLQFFGFVRQFVRATARDRRRFLAAVRADSAGDAQRCEAQLVAIFHTRREALHDPKRIGNSLVDLRLSVKGWRFGDDLETRRIATRAEAMAWLRREVYDPARVRDKIAPVG
jgi:hypothetical protein